MPMRWGQHKLNAVKTGVCSKPLVLGTEQWWMVISSKIRELTFKKKGLKSNYFEVALILISTVLIKITFGWVFTRKYRFSVCNSYDASKMSDIFALQGDMTGAGPVLTLLSFTSSVPSKTQMFLTQLWPVYLAFYCCDLCAEKTQSRSWHNNRRLKLHLGDIRQVAVWGITVGISALSLWTYGKYRPGGGEKRHIGDISEYWPFVCLRFSVSVSVSCGTHTHTHQTRAVKETRDLWRFILSNNN